MVPYHSCHIMGLGGAKKWRGGLKSSYGDYKKQRGRIHFSWGKDPSRHHVTIVGTGISFLHYFLKFYKHIKNSRTGETIFIIFN